MKASEFVRAINAKKDRVMPVIVLPSHQFNSLYEDVVLLKPEAFRPGAPGVIKYRKDGLVYTVVSKFFIDDWGVVS